MEWGCAGRLGHGVSGGRINVGGPICGRRVSGAEYCKYPPSPKTRQKDSTKRLDKRTRQKDSTKRLDKKTRQKERTL